MRIREQAAPGGWKGKGRRDDETTQERTLGGRKEKSATGRSGSESSELLGIQRTGAKKKEKGETCKGRKEGANTKKKTRKQRSRNRGKSFVRKAKRSPEIILKLFSTKSGGETKRLTRSSTKGR